MYSASHTELVVAQTFVMHGTTCVCSTPCCMVQPDMNLSQSQITDMTLIMRNTSPQLTFLASKGLVTRLSRLRP